VIREQRVQKGSEEFEGISNGRRIEYVENTTEQQQSTTTQTISTASSIEGVLDYINLLYPWAGFWILITAVLDTGGKVCFRQHKKAKDRSTLRTAIDCAHFISYR